MLARDCLGLVILARDWPAWLPAWLVNLPGDRLGWCCWLEIGWAEDLLLGALLGPGSDAGHPGGLMRFPDASQAPNE